MAGLGLARRLALAMAAAAVLGSATAIAGLGLVGASAYLITRAALHPPSILMLLAPIAVVRGFSLAKAVLRYADRLSSHQITLRAASLLKAGLFARLAAVPALVSTWAAGDIAQRLAADVDRLQGFFVDAVAPVAVFGLTAAVAVGWTAAVAPPLAPTLAAGLAVAGIGLPSLGVVAAARRRQSVAALESRLAGFLAKALTASADWLAAGLKAAVQARLGRLQDALASHLARLEGTQALLAAQSGALAWLTVLAMLAQAVAPGMPPAVHPLLLLPVVALVALGAFDSAAAVAQSSPVWVEAIYTARRLFGGPSPALGGQAGARGRLDLEAAGLWVAVGQPPRWVLRDAAFRVEAGSRVAVLGPSGAGKSTLLAVMAGFFPYQRGRLTLGGVEVRQWDLEALRRTLTWVGERSHLFRASVEENLRLANRGASRAQMEQALAAVGLAAWLERLPQGLATPLDQVAAGLSGGERRRLLLARALLRDTPWVLLDEPLAALDDETARLVAAALARWSRGRTVLVVTHEAMPPTWPMDAWWHLDGGRLARVSPPAADAGPAVAAPASC